MPKGPQGQKRKADVIGNAVLIGRIATGEVEDKKRDSLGNEASRKGGLKGGAARAKALSSKRRKEIAQKAANSRWKK